MSPLQEWQWRASRAIVHSINFRIKRWYSVLSLSEERFEVTNTETTMTYKYTKEWISFDSKLNEQLNTLDLKITTTIITKTIPIQGASIPRN